MGKLEVLKRKAKYVQQSDNPIANSNFIDEYLKYWEDNFSYNFSTNSKEEKDIFGKFKEVREKWCLHSDNAFEMEKYGIVPKTTDPLNDSKYVNFNKKLDYAKTDDGINEYRKLLLELTNKDTLDKIEKIVKPSERAMKFNSENEYKFKNEKQLCMKLGHSCRQTIRRHAKRISLRKYRKYYKKVSGYYTFPSEYLTQIYNSLHF